MSELKETLTAHDAMIFRVSLFSYFDFPLKTILGRKHFANFLETQIDPSKDNNDGKNGANAARSG